ncbi:MAG: prepilin-type N-terminal cleavage/methylation domain-containing protein [Proteobacteria bacterium]|nr:prepilin-type N-terminal cleavage/methylation domain-containing protein [Pseudomonadota bacterium]
MKQTNKGFTLVELMIVIAIIGVLAAVSYPSYTSYVKKAQCADGIDSLISLAGRMEEFYMNADTYDGATVGASGTVGSDQTSEGLYTLAVTNAGAFGYTITATPKDAAQNTLTLDSLGQKSEAGGAAGVAASCW